MWPELGLMRKGSLVELREHQATWQGFSDALAAAVEFVVTPLLFALFHPGVRVAREQLERAAHPTGETTGTAVVDLDSARRKRA